MTPRSLINTVVEVEAVLSSMRMRADGLAALAPGDHLDLEAHAGSVLTVRLMADGATVATAALAVEDGRLIATIINSGSGIAGRRIDQWKHSKAVTTA
jgi:flagellar motor switch/type III secretory pathway protein FliN